MSEQPIRTQTDEIIDLAKKLAAATARVAELEGAMSTCSGSCHNALAAKGADDGNDERPTG